MITSSHSRLVRDLPRCQCLSVHCAVSQSPVPRPSERRPFHRPYSCDTRDSWPPSLTQRDSSTVAPFPLFLDDGRPSEAERCMHPWRHHGMDAQTKSNPIGNVSPLFHLQHLTLAAFLEALLPILLNVCFKNPYLSNP